MRPSAVLIALLPLAASAQAPPLPTLQLDAYPPPMRRAVTPVYQAASSRPTDPAGVGALARVLHAWEQWDDAHAAYRRAQALRPAMFDWHYLDADVLLRQGRHAEAAEQLRLALGVSPDYLPARVKLAETLVKLAQFPESERLFEDLARNSAAEPLARFGLGQIAFVDGRHQEAISHLQRAIVLFPEWGEAHYTLARAYRAVGREEDAVRAVEARVRFGALAPGLEDAIVAETLAMRKDARASLERGLKLAEAGDLRAAIAVHEDALREHSSLAQAHLNLIQLYGRVENWPKVEEHVQAATTLGFGIADANYNYGVALQAQKKIASAEAAYARAVAANPQHAKAHTALGVLLAERHEHSAALEKFRVAVASDPTYATARYHVGRALVALGRFGEAVAEFERISDSRDDEAPLYLLGLAVAHAGAGQITQAISRAQQAKDLAIARGKYVEVVEPVLRSLQEPRQ